MTIANPIYDIVFKYLLEDLDIVLEKVSTAVLHSTPCYRDVLTNQSIPDAREEEFVNLLNHESYFIQIPKLVEPTKTQLEEVLSIFNQTFKTANEHALNYEIKTDNPLLQKMLSRLTRAIADETMRKKMDVKDEIEREFQDIEEK